MSKKRIVITGIGATTPLGIGKEAFWKGIEGGKSGISSLEIFDPARVPVKIAGEIKNFDPSKWLDSKLIRRIDRNTQFALITSREAVVESGLDLKDPLISSRMGIVMGTAIGGNRYMLDQDAVIHKRGPMKISPYTVLNSFPDACAAQIAIDLGITGPSFAVSTACSSALDAIGVSLDLLESGRVDYVLTGGSEAPLCEPIVAAFAIVRALSTNNENPQTASRPFDETRDGFVMGEGAGMFVFEEYEHAKARGAKIYAEILGHGMTCDAHHITAPEPEGKEAIRAIGMALEKANISPEQIDYINAHGTSTPLNDKTETLIIKKVFGNHAKKIPVSSVKSMIGHLIGASGAVELIASILGMHKGIVPPTINYKTPDPDCDLDYVPNQARPHKFNTLMKNSFGFGGKNSILIVRKI